MHAEIVSSSELSARDLEAWAQLAAAAASPNPFAEPDFVVPAVRRLDATGVGLLIVREGSDWLAALPVRSQRSWRGVPGRCLAGWRHLYCFLGTPLVAADDPAAVLAALIERGLQPAGCLALDWIDADGPLAGPLSEALGKSGRPILVEEFDRAALHWHATPGSALSDAGQAASGAPSKELGRGFRRLQREVGELTVRARGDDPDAYQEFLTLERSGWKGTAGTALACNPEHAAFFLELCERFARSGRLRLLSLGTAEHTVAMIVDLIADQTVFGFKAAFDDRLAKFSPGIQLHRAAVEQFPDTGLARIDTCADQHSSTMNRLFSDRRRLRSVAAARGGAVGVPQYIKWRAASAARAARQRIKDR